MKISEMSILSRLAIMLTLVFTSVQCSKVEDEILDLRLRKDQVSSQKGSTFVSVECGGQWELYLMNEDGSDVTWAEVSPASGSGRKSNVILSYQENKTEKARSLTLVLSSGSKDVTVVFKQLAQGEEIPGPDVDPTPTPGPDSGSAFNGKLMELPAMSDEDIENYYRHDFKLNGIRYRNYSFVWNESKKVAPWVAYPLCGVYTKKSVNRTDAWDEDPLLSSGEQPMYFSGIRGYDRGHQIPSADRLCSYEANAQTFYFTNMTPQLAGLNQHAWRELEDRVRSWSSKLDTLYVVTGCLTEGNKTATDRGGNTISVPSGYYKALLGYKKSGTIGDGGFVGIAYYMDHKSANSFYGCEMTINDLETKTGMDFFVNLNPYIADQVESKIDSFWGI